MSSYRTIKKTKEMEEMEALSWLFNDGASIQIV